ncbi:MAG: hypothetical protein WCV58_02710 [Patescibacteria group bacterium]
MQQPPPSLRFYSTTFDLVENVAIEGTPILWLSSFIRRDEHKVTGHIMRRRAKKLGNCAGQLHAERMLLQQGSIPHEWRKFYLVFAGTVWHDSRGFCIPYLYYDDNEWIIDLYWLDHDALNNDNSRLVRFE